MLPMDHARAADAAPAQPAVDVSVVVPFMNEEATLCALLGAVAEVCDGTGLTFEVVFVDDGSTDGSVAALVALAASHPEITVLSLRRNFGKAAALATGFRAARGGCVISMDADLQDDPNEIPELVALVRSGYGVVSGWKKERHDPLSRRLASKVFNAVTRKISGVELHDFNCGLKAYSSEAAREIADTCYGELHRYLPVLAHWRGYRVTEKVVTHHPRQHGTSRYGLERYVRGTCDLLTTWYMTKYQRRPMHAFGGLALLGGALAAVAMLAALVLLGLSAGGAGVAAVLAGVFVAGAVQAVLLGIVAELVSRDHVNSVPFRAVVDGAAGTGETVIELGVARHSGLGHVAHARAPRHGGQIGGVGLEDGVTA